MANLKINSDIISESERQFLKVFFGLDEGVSYNSIESFLESIPEDDNSIDISIHCNGGEVMEGWSIYDKLRASGKEISATIEGKCASMASIILLAAPKDRRSGRPNASLLVHEPYISRVSGQMTADELFKIAESMKLETDKIVNTYVERTGTDEKTIRAIMKEDKFIDMDKSIELGFISKIIAPLSAKHTNQTNINNNKMTSEDNVKVSKPFIEKVLAKLGYSKIEDAVEGLMAVALVLTTESGATLTVERDAGEPQVGDKASPDGTHVMPDGKTIVVADGVITEIKKKETPSEEATALKARVAELEGLLLTANNNVESAKNKAKTEAEIEILEKVKILGGIEKLRTIASSYVPPKRNEQANNVNNKNNPEGEKTDPFRVRIEKLEKKEEN